MASDVAQMVVMTDELRLGESPSQGASASLRLVIERAKSGDAAAFENLIICIQRRVVSTAWRMLGNEEDARDAAQEVFLRTYKYLNKYKAEQDFYGWLYRIIVNACHDIARKRTRSARFSSFEAEREMGNLETLAGPDDVEAAAILSQEQSIIARALETLSAKERAAIVLRDMEGLSTEEVAAALGSSQGTVRSQVSSARAKIKLYRERVLKQRR